MSLTFHRYTAQAAAGMACNEDARAGDRGPGWLLSGGWPSCGMTPGR
jgi:hypothetical protein